MPRSNLLTRRGFGLAVSALGLSVATGTRSSDGAAINDQMTGYITNLHDPVMIREGKTWHVFGSGGWQHGALMTWRTSPDLIQWTDNAPPFDAMPAWAQAGIPDGKSMWAPDISHVDGLYRLYYAVSTGGSMRSMIGLATSRTLDRTSPAYGWTDHGMVLETHPGDGYNAIDPNFVVDFEGNHWLAFGSYWSGLKLIALDKATGKPPAGARLASLAYRPAPDGADNAIEASFVYKHDGWYYLFASYDHCCRKQFSDYYVACGRSKSISGPYMDRDGKALMEGYGTSVIYDRPYLSHRFIGPGHCAVVGDGNRDLLVYHAYDRDHDSIPTLRISPIAWSADGWPSAQL